MKNVKNVLKKSCLYTNLETFESIVREALQDWDNSVNVECAMDGISIYSDDDNWSDEEICEKLTEYFGVEKVTSFHADDCNYPVGIWIVYKDK